MGLSWMEVAFLGQMEQLFDSTIVRVVSGLILAVIVLKILRWVLRKPKGAPNGIELGDLKLPTQDRGLLLSVRHVPCRVGIVVVAPLGPPSQPPSPAQVPKLLDQLVPGMSRAVKRDEPVINILPREMNILGFAVAMARHVHTTEVELRQSPWCLVCGRAIIGGKLFAIGLALGATTDNSLGVIKLEKDRQWLEVLQLRRD